MIDPYNPHPVTRVRRESLYDKLDRLRPGQVVVLSVSIVFAFWLFFVFGLAGIHGAWCRSQFRVARDHADTVSAVRWCGAPKEASK